MDYPCDKFGGFSFSRFGFTVRTDRQVRITVSQTITELGSNFRSKNIRIFV